MGLFNLTGPEFLKVYILLIVAAIVIAIVVRRLLNVSFARPSAASASLDPISLGLLAGGNRRAMEVAVILLQTKKFIDIEPSGKLKPLATTHPHLHPLEKRILDLAWEGASRTKLYQSCGSVLRRIEHDLSAEGYLTPPETHRSLVLLTWAIFGIVLLIGVIKLFVGVDRGKPVGYLIGLLVLTFVFGWLMSRLLPRRTPTGNAMLSRATGDVGERRPIDLDVGLPLTPLVFTSLALYGPTILEGERAKRVRESTAGCDGGGMWVSSGGDSGSGASCGGGGGCGGCGGGD
ncbi:MAG TPA: TIGR04222 domain-containing membrane protein [Tepidisphaeraceae bacterium]|nr:TIGR04222 domain-containing membrane protein [Tepidisphaeraceae bacterium]